MLNIPHVIRVKHRSLNRERSKYTIRQHFTYDTCRISFTQSGQLKQHDTSVKPYFSFKSTVRMNIHVTPIALNIGKNTYIMGKLVLSLAHVNAKANARDEAIAQYLNQMQMRNV